MGRARERGKGGGIGESKEKGGGEGKESKEKGGGRGGESKEMGGRGGVGLAVGRRAVAAGARTSLEVRSGRSAGPAPMRSLTLPALSSDKTIYLIR